MDQKELLSKWVANPVEVTAYKIWKVSGGNDVFQLEIGNDDKSDYQTVIATPDMTARMTPKVGDYWVIQSDGYIYLNPKEVFERKYHKKEKQ
jgi:hypothetical protein